MTSEDITQGRYLPKLTEDYDLTHKVKTGDIGLEHPSLTLSKTLISETGGTESGTVDYLIVLKDPDLLSIIKAWPTLAGNIKKAFKALVG